MNFSQKHTLSLLGNSLGTAVQYNAVIPDPQVLLTGGVWRDCREAQLI